jgi:RNA polymerase sigma-70 factor (ECF subfamily)
MAIDTVRTGVVSTEGLDVDAKLLRGRAAGGPVSAPEPAPSLTAHDYELAQLIERMAGGDQGALGQLYDRTGALVHGLAARILRDPSAAEEITIEVYTQAYQHAWRYDAGRGTPLAWLLTMARSRALSRLRRDAPRTTREMPMDDRRDLVATTGGPDDFSAASEARRRVLKALAGLSSDQRRAIELAYYLGLSHREIATRLGQPLGTVKTHIRRGMVLLREQLG